jgi:hypothetical protein
MVRIDVVAREEKAQKRGPEKAERTSDAAAPAEDVDPAGPLAGWRRPTGGRRSSCRLIGDGWPTAGRR